MKNLKILAISGSLRAKSSNANVLEAMKILAPSEVEIQLYSDLATLPHFNPDLDREPLPDAIKALHQKIKTSDGILIYSPEYAHGVPGSLKNALDWLVSSTEFPGKPVALVNTNPRATIALASLTEILQTMSAKIISSASVTVAIAGKSLSVEDIATDLEFSKILQKIILIFAEQIAEEKQK